MGVDEKNSLIIFSLYIYEIDFFLEKEKGLLSIELFEIEIECVLTKGRTI